MILSGAWYLFQIVGRKIVVGDVCASADIDLVLKNRIIPKSNQATECIYTPLFKQASLGKHI